MRRDADRGPRLKQLDMRCIQAAEISYMHGALEIGTNHGMKFVGSVGERIIDTGWNHKCHPG